MLAPGLSWVSQEDARADMAYAIVVVDYSFYLLDLIMSDVVLLLLALLYNLLKKEEIFSLHRNTKMGNYILLFSLYDGCI